MGNNEIAGDLWTIIHSMLQEECRCFRSLNQDQVTDHLPYGRFPGFSLPEFSMGLLRAFSLEDRAFSFIMFGNPMKARIYNYMSSNEYLHSTESLNQINLKNEQKDILRCFLDSMRLFRIAGATRNLEIAKRNYESAISNLDQIIANYRNVIQDVEFRFFRTLRYLISYECYFREEYSKLRYDESNYSDKDELFLRLEEFYKKSKVKIEEFQGSRTGDENLDEWFSYIGRRSKAYTTLYFLKILESKLHNLERKQFNELVEQKVRNCFFHDLKKEIDDYCCENSGICPDLSKTNRIIDKEFSQILSNVCRELSFSNLKKENLSSSIEWAEESLKNQVRILEILRNLSEEFADDEEISTVIGYQTEDAKLDVITTLSLIQILGHIENLEYGGEDFIFDCYGLLGMVSLRLLFRNPRRTSELIDEILLINERYLNFEGRKKADTEWYANLFRVFLLFSKGIEKHDKGFKEAGLACFTEAYNSLEILNREKNSITIDFWKNTLLAWERHVKAKDFLNMDNPNLEEVVEYQEESIRAFQEAIQIFQDNLDNESVQFMTRIFRDEELWSQKEISYEVVRNFSGISKKPQERNLLFLEDKFCEYIATYNTLMKGWKNYNEYGQEKGRTDQEAFESLRKASEFFEKASKKFHDLFDCRRSVIYELRTLEMYRTIFLNLHRSSEGGEREEEIGNFVRKLELFLMKIIYKYYATDNAFEKKLRIFNDVDERIKCLALASEMVNGKEAAYIEKSKFLSRNLYAILLTSEIDARLKDLRKDIDKSRDINLRTRQEEYEEIRRKMRDIHFLFEENVKRIGEKKSSIRDECLTDAMIEISRAILSRSEIDVYKFERKTEEIVVESILHYYNTARNKLEGHTDILEKFVASKIFEYEHYKIELEMIDILFRMTRVLFSAAETREGDGLSRLIADLCEKNFEAVERLVSATSLLIGEENKKEIHELFKRIKDNIDKKPPEEPFGLFNCLGNLEIKDEFKIGYFGRILETFEHDKANIEYHISLMYYFKWLDPANMAETKYNEICVRGLMLTIEQLQKVTGQSPVLEELRKLGEIIENYRRDDVMNFLKFYEILDLLTRASPIYSVTALFVNVALQRQLEKTETDEKLSDFLPKKFHSCQLLTLEGDIIQIGNEFELEPSDESREILQFQTVCEVDGRKYYRIRMTKSVDFLPRGETEDIRILIKKGEKEIREANIKVRRTEWEDVATNQEGTNLLIRTDSDEPIPFLLRIDKTRGVHFPEFPSTIAFSYKDSEVHRSLQRSYKVETDRNVRFKLCVSITEWAKYINKDINVLDMLGNDCREMGMNE
ncbi:MAG: hypothetical protein HXS41_02495 [Theionarchaea archaeon]|nr:hypothetical protein [Theionarchaea archaeon]MBU7019902.1 hypothetical protein [Theionarchaea archaeon]